MGLYRKLFFPLVLIGISFNALGQRDSSGFSCVGSYLYGYNFNGRNDRNFGSSSPYGYSLYIQRQKYGKKAWQRSFNYPQTGWNLVYFDHRNQYLGQTLSLYHYINFPLYRNKFLKCHLKSGVGLVYATKIYEYRPNQQTYNNAISQPISLTAQLGLNFVVYPHPRFGVLAGCTVYHFSNGAMTFPNSGLNIVAAELGAVYRIGTEKSFKTPPMPNVDKKMRFNGYMGTGITQIQGDHSRHYGLFASSVYVDRRLTRVYALNMGLDLFCNLADRQLAKQVGKNYESVGISAGNELLIGRVGLIIQGGYHLYNPFPATSNFYQKAGLKYYLTDRWIIAFSLKAYNFSISDEITFGVGIRL